jgi:hypothetical protein
MNATQTIPTIASPEQKAIEKLSSDLERFTQILERIERREREIDAMPINEIDREVWIDGLDAAFETLADSTDLVADLAPKTKETPNPKSSTIRNPRPTERQRPTVKTGKSR